MGKEYKQINKRELLYFEPPKESFIEPPKESFIDPLYSFIKINKVVSKWLLEKKKISYKERAVILISEWVVESKRKEKQLSDEKRNTENRPQETLWNKYFIKCRYPYSEQEKLQREKNPPVFDKYGYSIADEMMHEIAIPKKPFAVDVSNILMLIRETVVHKLNKRKLCPEYYESMARQPKSLPVERSFSSWGITRRLKYPYKKSQYSKIEGDPLFRIMGTRKNHQIPFKNYYNTDREWQYSYPYQFITLYEYRSIY